MQTVLITGANRGIGLAFCKAYATSGWSVIATARNPDAATEVHKTPQLHGCATTGLIYTHLSSS